MAQEKISLEQLLDRAAGNAFKPLECTVWRNDRDILVVEFRNPSDKRIDAAHLFVIIDNVATPIDAQSEDY